MDRPTPLPIKIFISSPADVSAERDIAFEIIEKINANPLLQDRVTLKGIGWDRLESRVPLSAWEPPQDAIKRGMPPPSRCEIVVVILWMRFGTPMPRGFEKKPDGSPYLSGTEYEYMDAVAAARESTTNPTRPQVLVYRRPQIGLSDETSDFDEKRVQKNRVQDFFRHFRAPDGAAIGGINRYEDPDDFRAKFEHDINYLVRLFQDAAAPKLVDARSFLPDAPPYQLMERVGKGGMAEVWRAEQISAEGNRTVALKKLLKEVNPAHVQRFREEMAILKLCTHPNIIPVFDYGVLEDRLYLTMPLMVNGSLVNWMQAHPGPVPRDRAFRWLDQVASALDYAHKKGVTAHRDIKPANLLLFEDDENLALTDFGIARSDLTGVDVTHPGEVIGTPRYMAPEQWQSEGTSAQTDIYALGILAYELLTGKPPYPTIDHSELHRQHLAAWLPEDSTGHLTPEILGVLRIATARAPGERYQTAREFMHALRQAEAGIAPISLDMLIQAYLEQALSDIAQDVREQYVAQIGKIAHLGTFDATQWHSGLDLAADPVSRFRARKAQRDALLNTGQIALEAVYRRPDAPKAEPITDVREQLLNHANKRVVLLGEPGSGKSFTLTRLFADYADRWLEALPTERSRHLIPVFVPLREYDGTDGAGRAWQFAEFVRTKLGTLMPYQERLLRDNRLVFLCDGLNEMPRGASDANMEAVRAYLTDKPHFVVSCRERDYRHDLTPLKPLDQVYLQDLDLPRIKQLILKRLPELGPALWKSIGGTEDLERFWTRVVQAEREADFWKADTEWPFGEWEEKSAWKAIHNGSRLLILCRNPFIACVLCCIDEDRQGTLPGSRAALFRDFADTLLVREEANARALGWTRPVDAIETIKIALSVVAYAMQTAKRTTLERTRACEAIRADTRIPLDAELIIGAAMASSILAQDGDGDDATLRFTHHLLQEYFAALVMCEAMDADEKAGTNTAAHFFQHHGGDGWWDAGVWRETPVILGEFLGGRAAGPNRVARWLAPVSPEVALSVILRNGDGLTLADVEPDTVGALIAGANARMAEPNPRGRAAAYRILGTFDCDPRPGVGLRSDGLPDLLWCPVPCDEAQPDYSLPAFCISKYPITHKQFQAFLDAPDGFKESGWWEGLHPEGYDQHFVMPENPPSIYWNYPRERVSWYDAIAFCRWLTSKLGGEITLPTSQQWKAACGTDEREYPYAGGYDPTRANTHDTGIGQASAVGIFPDGECACGALDMSGNVWEWCLDESGSGRVNIGSKAFRALAGGSWFDSQASTRADSRNRSLPIYRVGGFGFRVVQLVTGQLQP